MVDVGKYTIHGSSGYMGVSKNRWKTPKMDWGKHGKAFLKRWDDLVKSTIFGNIHISYTYILDLIIYTCMLCVFILDFVSFV